MVFDFNLFIKQLPEGSTHDVLCRSPWVSYCYLHWHAWRICRPKIRRTGPSMWITLVKIWMASSLYWRNSFFCSKHTQGEAIAHNLRTMFGLKVPIISIVIGEGGSGGALAIGCANKLLMLENAVFYVARWFNFLGIAFSFYNLKCIALLL